MDFTKLGPNGGLIYAMEYLIENTTWLEDQVRDLCEDDYVLFDCPGQLELYTHLDLMKKVTKSLVNLGFALCSVCLVDSTFLVDDSKFYSGILM
jgi:GTPase SAR1 family protein